MGCCDLEHMIPLIFISRMKSKCAFFMPISHSVPVVAQSEKVSILLLELPINRVSTDVQLLGCRGYIASARLQNAPDRRNFDLLQVIHGGRL